MDRFKENKCRLCKKVFCCIKCRKKHEENIHLVNADCNICLYGKATLTNTSETLLLHIKSKHWPLYCVNCNRIFGTVEELSTNNKCPVNKDIINDTFFNKIPVTPNILLENCNDSNYESPPFMHAPGKNASLNITVPNVNNAMQLTTSTPMQDDEDKRFLENISEAITPVEAVSKENDKNSAETNLELPKECMKRRVTFNETTISELFKSHNNSETDKETSLKEINSEGNETEESFDETDNYQNQTNLSNTTWETAISDTPKLPEKEHILVFKTNKDDGENINLYKADSLCMNLIKLDSSTEKHNTNFKSSDIEEDPSSTIWSFLTNLVQNVMSSLPSTSAQSITDGKKQMKLKATPSRKRLSSETDMFDNLKCLKKMKFTDIQCRKPINCTVPYKSYLQKTARNCDKATQTD